MRKIYVTVEQLHKGKGEGDEVLWRGSFRYGGNDWYGSRFGSM
jgi:hypothetical protein